VPRAKEASNRRALLLLAGQAFALGLLVAWITIAASAIFLDTYGSGALPLTYIGAAAAGALASAALTRALRRRSLVSVAKRVLAAFAVLLAGSFAGLWVSGPWVSVVLLVLIPILVPVGFVFVVGQAGMLLDVRTLKASYARVVAGFALGFVIGGSAGPLLLDLAGRTEALLAFAAAVAAMFLALAWWTERSFPAQLSTIAGDATAEIVKPTIRSLLRNRYVVCIVTFQMLSAVESQWLDFLVYDRAAARYASNEALADFISRFTAIAYGADIVFLVLVAGLLLKRFGLRYGLTANSAVVLALVVAMIVAASLQSSGGMLVFVLVVASRVSDLTLSDGTSRTSLGAAYQAVPLAERLAAQATVEGLAVPLAIGASGLVLIVVRATVGTGGLALPVLTSIVVIAWMVVSLFVYRGYRVNLLANLRHRTLDPSTLEIDDANTLAAIDRLLDSVDERDVRLGLHTLAVAEHPQLTARLDRLALDDRVGVRSHALDRLRTLDPSAAATSARLGLLHRSAPIRAVSLRTLAATGGRSDLAAVVEHWDDPHHEVRLAAAVAIAEFGDEGAKARISIDTTELSRADDAEGPMLAARVLAKCGPDTGIDRGSLRQLLAHSEHEVVKAALAAVHLPHDFELLDDVVVHLENRRTSPATLEALVRGGPHMLELIDLGLGGSLGFGRHSREVLARACGQIGGDEAAAVLRHHLDDRDREVGLAVAVALAALAGDTTGGAESSVQGVGTDASLDRMIRTDLEDATYALRALHLLGDADAFAVLCRALRDELHLLRHRLLACMSSRYGPESLSRVQFQLAQPDVRAHAVAMEWLDVTLTGADRAVMALLEPAWSAGDRMRALARWFPLPEVGIDEVLRDLVADPSDRWRRPWLTACALMARANIEGQHFRDPAPAAVRTPGGENEGTMDIVGETLAGIRSRLQLSSPTL
jgi:hypothetical protein